jgi:electron transfer flavoprotein alpha subunit
MGQNKEIWIYAEQREGQLVKVNFELLSKATELCKHLEADLVAILVGHGVEKLALELSVHADKVYAVDDPKLELYQNQAYASAVADLIREHKPEILLMGATEIGEDLAPCVAAKVKTGLTTHCIDIRIEDYEGIPILFQTVPGWGGAKRIDIICPQARPQMATVKPGVFATAATTKDRKGKVSIISPQLDDRLFRAKTVAMKEKRPSELPLEEAKVVVAAGWGINSLGSLDQVQELSDVVGGAIAGTRPLLDKGYIAETQMIGQSGKTVSPKLFISLGASGAMHFTTGFEKAKYVLAVDQNPQAPIFQVADVGIIGGLREVMPHLIEEFKKFKS